MLPLQKYGGFQSSSCVCRVQAPTNRDTSMAFYRPLFIAARRALPGRCCLPLPLPLPPGPPPPPFFTPPWRTPPAPPPPLPAVGRVGRVA